jgi:hypothetical protein
LENRKTSCNYHKLMNSLISSTGNSPVILRSLNKIHWLPHKQIQFHRGMFNPGYIHIPVYKEFTVATVMLPPIFHYYMILTSDQNSFSWWGIATSDCCEYILRHQHYTNHHHG